MFAAIINRQLRMFEGKPTLETMQKVVGGIICTAVRCQSPKRDNITVEAYVNDEGLLIDLPIDHVRLTDSSYLAGNIIITGADENTGDTVEVTRDEIAEMLKWIGRLPSTLNPKPVESKPVRENWSTC